MAFHMQKIVILVVCTPFPRKIFMLLQITITIKSSPPHAYNFIQTSACDLFEAHSVPFFSVVTGLGGERVINKHVR